MNTLSSCASICQGRQDNKSLAGNTLNSQMPAKVLKISLLLFFRVEDGCVIRHLREACREGEGRLLLTPFRCAEVCDVQTPLPSGGSTIGAKPHILKVHQERLHWNVASI